MKKFVAMMMALAMMFTLVACGGKNAQPSPAPTTAPVATVEGTMEELLNKVVEILRTTDLVACTNCRYCVAGCPQEIKIPDWFTKKNAKIIRNEDLPDPDGGTPADCVGCGQCEEICPQKLKIRELLEKY